MKRTYHRPLNRDHMKRRDREWGFVVILILVAVALLIGNSAQACDEVYFKVGAGYKFVEADSLTVKGVDHKVDGWSPYSARFEIGKQKGAWTYGVSHHSQWLTGAPFNNIKEYHKTEFFVDYKWGW